MAVHVYSLLNSYIYGFALQEVSLPFNTERQAVEVTDAILQQFHSDDYPHLAEVGIEHVTHGYAYADEFEFGLDVILNGMDHVR
jgi:tetracycline repressor-like protein